MYSRSHSSRLLKSWVNSGTIGREHLTGSSGTRNLNSTRTIANEYASISKRGDARSPISNRYVCPAANVDVTRHILKRCYLVGRNARRSRDRDLARSVVGVLSKIK